MMKKIDIEKYKNAWNEKSADQLGRLNKDEIRKFLSANSQSIERLFLNGLIMDIVMKSILGITFFVHVYLFNQQQHIVILCILLLMISIISVFFQRNIYLSVPVEINFHGNIRESLKQKITFYNSKYIMSLLVSATSSSLIFLSGMLFYFYFEYGGVRHFDLEDYFVFGGAILLSFVFTAVVQIKQHNFQVKQLESCLDEIDEDTINEHSVKTVRKRRYRHIIIFSLTVILGLLLFTYFLFR